MKTTRRQLGSMAIGGALLPAIGITRARAADNVAKVAMIGPLTGAWARQGQLMRLGGEMAIDDINNSGGIRTMGGMKMQLIVLDTGDFTESAKDAAQRLVSQNPDVSAGTGAWLSSFTLAVTEVTERAQIPWTTVSFADSITSRGFHYIFQTSATSGQMAGLTLPTVVNVAKAAGKTVKTMAMIGDNTASVVAFSDAVRKQYAKELGIKIVVDQTFTPPLSDATSLVQPLRSAKPDFLLLQTSNVPDDKLAVDKLHEMGLGKLPVVSSGAHFATPELLKATGPDELQGIMITVGDWGAKGQEELIARFQKRTGEPWMTQDSVATYGDMMLFRQAIETAKSTDRNKVADAIRGFDLTDGPAMYYSGHRVKFDDKGRRVGAEIVIVQWQNGVPMTIFPEDMAVAKPIWNT